MSDWATYFAWLDEQPCTPNGLLVRNQEGEVRNVPRPGMAEFRTRLSLPALSVGPKPLEYRRRRRRSVPTGMLRLKLDEMEVRMRASDREAAELEAR
jgi:hypothetical protein